jgi:hypothetical protein
LAQAIEHLPSKYEALCSNSSTAKTQSNTKNPFVLHDCNPSWQEAEAGGLQFPERLAHAKLVRPKLVVVDTTTDLCPYS